jgi:F-type H+-transporting ATPase subunit b
MLHSLLIFASDAAAHAPAGSHAPGSHSEVIDPSNWLPGVTALIVFLIAFGFLYVKVWPMIVKGLDARENKIRSEIAAAEAAREQAKAALAEYKDNLAKAREEAGAMIAKARSDAKAVADELRSRNEAELVEMKQRATKDIETAKQAAIGALHAEASNLAVAIAGKILQREINSKDQQMLVDQSIRELASARN